MRRDGNVVTMTDFDEALESFRIDFEGRRGQLQQYLNLAERFCNDMQFLDQLKRSMKMGGRLGALKEEFDLEDLE